MIQPTDIEKYLTEKGKKIHDKMGWTGEFHLSAKDMIDLLIHFNMENENEVPRRNRLDLNTPAEIAINNALQEVEKLPPHTITTEVVLMLSVAKNRLADYVESISN